ncbi:hypothetical protein A1F94_011808 [Pyrenophora tritici-repentis]|nr:hypothetical protein A1F94_011808 [Pyrenophora tritici-repentis]
MVHQLRLQDRDAYNFDYNKGTANRQSLCLVTLDCHPSKKTRSKDLTRFTDSLNFDQEMQEATENTHKAQQVKVWLFIDSRNSI